MTCYAIGVDIGATFIKLVLIDQDGIIHQRGSVSTPKDPDPEVVVNGIIEAAIGFKQRAESAGYTVDGMGFTIPHWYEGEDWIQRETNNMPSLEGFPMYPPLRKAFGPSIAMINDVSAAGIAEHMFGEGRDADRMLLMAIGTGIATCVITEEGMAQYNWGSTGDTGMIIVDPQGLTPCTCGARGCLEAVAAAPAIRCQALSAVERGKDTLLAKIKAENGDLEAHDVAEAARAGDAVAKDIFEQVGYFVGVALTSYMHIFRPDLIVLGGGVAQAGELLTEPVRRTMDRLGSPWYLARLRGIEISALGTDGGAIGCATLILYPGKYLR